MNTNQQLLFTQLISGETKMKSEEEFEMLRSIYLDQCKETDSEYLLRKNYQRALKQIKVVCETTKNIDHILKIINNI